MHDILVAKGGGRSLGQGVRQSLQREREIGESRVAASILRYARRSFGIIARAYRDYWPMQFFGLLAAIVSVPGLGLLIFLGIHRLRSGMFTPHIWSGFVGGSLMGFAAVCLLIGILGSILKRIRLNQEEMLYFAKKKQHEANCSRIAKKTK